MDTIAVLCDGKIHVGKGQGRRSLGWTAVGMRSIVKKQKMWQILMSTVAVSWSGTILKKALGATSWRALIGNLRNVEFIF